VPTLAVARDEELALALAEPAVRTTVGLSTMSNEGIDGSILTLEF
jgi:hypothetical protein